MKIPNENIQKPINCGWKFCENQYGTCILGVFYENRQWIVICIWCSIWFSLSFLEFASKYQFDRNRDLCAFTQTNYGRTMRAHTKTNDNANAFPCILRTREILYLKCVRLNAHAVQQSVHGFGRCIVWIFAFVRMRFANNLKWLYFCQHHCACIGMMAADAAVDVVAAAVYFCQHRRPRIRPLDVRRSRRHIRTLRPIYTFTHAELKTCTLCWDARCMLVAIRDDSWVGGGFIASWRLGLKV